MNMILPFIEKLRSTCLRELEARGILKARKQAPREIQLEFDWLSKR